MELFGNERSRITLEAEVCALLCQNRNLIRRWRSDLHLSFSSFLLLSSSLQPLRCAHLFISPSSINITAAFSRKHSPPHLPDTRPSDVFRGTPQRRRAQPVRSETGRRRVSQANAIERIERGRDLIRRSLVLHTYRVFCCCILLYQCAYPRSLLRLRPCQTVGQTLSQAVAINTNHTCPKRSSLLSSRLRPLFTCTQPVRFCYLLLLP